MMCGATLQKLFFLNFNQALREIKRLAVSEVIKDFTDSTRVKKTALTFKLNRLVRVVSRPKNSVLLTSPGHITMSNIT